jgi:membrane protein
MSIAGVHALVRRFSDHQGLLLASALSFSFLLCLAPVALLLVAAAGFLLQSGDIAAYVLQTASSLVPGYSVEVSAALAVLTRERTVSGALGGIGLVTFATQLFTLTRTLMNIAFRVERRRSLIHGFVFDLFALAVAGLLAVVLCGALLATFALGGLARQFIPPDVLPALRWGRMAALALLYATLIGLLFFVYRAFPNVTVRARPAAIAALAVAALWEVARLAFGAYLTAFGTYGRLYGSFGVLVATLVWIYYSAAIFLLGAELAALLNDPGGAVPAVPPRRTDRSAGPRLAGGVVVVLAGAAGVIIAVQNDAPTRIRFLAWILDDVPLAGIVLAALAAGAGLVALPFWLDRARLRARLRDLEAQEAPAAEVTRDRC